MLRRILRGIKARAESQAQEVRGSGLPTRDRGDQNDVTLDA
jgi:hypothetical protein